MAEAVAFGASVVAFVQLADRVISLAKGYISALQDAPATIRAILVQVSALRAVLDSLVFLTQSGDQVSPDIVQRLGAPGGIVDLCREAVNDLANMLPDQVGPTSNTKKRKLTKLAAIEIMDRLAWPLKEERARKRLDEISRYGQSITLALSTQTIRELQDVKQSVEKISRSLSAKEMRDICNWLEHTNPSSLHDRTISLHEEHTGAWVLQTKEWKDWIAGMARSLWIHGIPGSGKSVLASFLIGKLEKHCASQDKYASLFYYCYFGHSQDESTPLLRWIISQLCRRSTVIPPGLVYLYDQNHSPRKFQLLSILEAVLQSFDTVFLSVDALDESEPRPPLLDLIKTLVTDSRFQKLQLLVTSREYLDIEEVMTGISLSLPMDHELIREDIRSYVHAHLNTSRDFRRWPVQLRSDIEQNLAHGAKGMFRWAVCQLDILRRLNTTAAINAALDALPETLDETYERILSSIPPSQRHTVRRVLVMLCTSTIPGLEMESSSEGFYITTIASALTATDDDTEHQDESIYDEAMLRDVCGCLVKIDEDTMNEDTRKKESSVTLAHYTVAEFILSQRSSVSSSSAVAYFAISPADHIREYGMLVLKTSTGYAGRYFLLFLNDPEHRDRTTREISDLKPLAWDYANVSENIPVDELEFLRKDSNALYRFMKLSLNGFVELAVLSLDGSFVDFSAYRNVVGMFVDCAMYNVDPCEAPYPLRDSHALLLKALSWTMDPTRLLILYLGSHIHSWLCRDDTESCPIWRAINNGADVNCTGYGKTPLQLAAERFDIAAVSLLLEHKANPNIIGAEGGEQLCGREFTPERRTWSPLRLCRRASCFLETVLSDVGGPQRNLCCGFHGKYNYFDDFIEDLSTVDSLAHDKLRQEVERMLIEHGARDFELSPDGVEISSQDVEQRSNLPQLDFATAKSRFWKTVLE